MDYLDDPTGIARFFYADSDEEDEFEEIPAQVQVPSSGSSPPSPVPGDDIVVPDDEQQFDFSLDSHEFEIAVPVQNVITTSALDPDDLDSPLQLLLNHSFLDAIEKLPDARDPDGRLTVVSICGRARSGKSTFLNLCLLGQGPDDEGSSQDGDGRFFGVSGGVDPCTEGINGCVIRLRDDGRYVVILDVEGSDVVNRDPEDEILLRSLALGISSCFLYNDQKNITRHFMLDLGKAMTMVKNRGIRQSGSVPRLVVLLRNANLKFRDDGDMSDDEYFKQQMKAIVIANSADESLREVIQELPNFFPEEMCRCCFLPTPIFGSETDLQNLASHLSALRPEFGDKMLELRKVILDPRCVKRTKSTPWNLDIFRVAVQSFVYALNEGKSFPFVESIAEFCTIRVREIETEYLKRLEEHNPIEDGTTIAPLPTPPRDFETIRLGRDKKLNRKIVELEDAVYESMTEAYVAKKNKVNLQEGLQFVEKFLELLHIDVGGGSIRNVADLEQRLRTGKQLLSVHARTTGRGWPKRSLWHVIEKKAIPLRKAIEEEYRQGVIRLRQQQRVELGHAAAARLRDARKRDADAEKRRIVGEILERRAERRRLIRERLRRGASAAEISEMKSRLMSLGFGFE